MLLSWNPLLTGRKQRLLDHLKEAAFFTDKDLTGIEHRLDKIEGSIERARAHHNPQIIVLLEAKIAACRANLVELRFIMEPIPKDLMATHEKLVSILRSLSGCNTRSNFPWAEINDYKRQLKEIESKLDVKAISEDVGGEDVSIDERMNRYAEKLSHISYTEASKLSGREIVRDLLERTILWGDLMTAREGKLDPRFQDKFNALSAIRNQLEKFSLTQAWSLRETDLYSYQRKLDRIDEERVNGNFIDESGRPADLYEQRTLLYLLRKSYSIIYFMLASSEPVSEALQPVYNQLSTLRKCLVEVKKSGGVSSPRELYPYSMKLHSLDNMRKDGKFIVNGDIPEGQASVIALLSECFEMAYELRNEAEKEEEEHEERPDEAENSAAIEMRQSAAGKGADAIPPDGGLARVVSVGGNH